MVSGARSADTLPRWISEKMDGVRAHWNGHRMLSKIGKEIGCPDWFVEGLPKSTELDGELWMGRGTLENLMAAINSSRPAEWKYVKYVVFDLPKSAQTFERRLEALESLKLPRHCEVVKRERCEGSTHLRQRLEEVVLEGGEGLMLNMPGSPYLGERTESLLKVKVPPLAKR